MIEISVILVSHRFNEDCQFSNCNYREHQTHFHCMRKDCNYRFCDKTRFVQVTLLGHKGGKDESGKVNKNANLFWGGGWSMRLSLLQWGISNRSTIQCLPISKFEKWKQQQYKYEGIVPARLCDDLNQQVRPGGLEVNFRNSVYADESAIFQSFSALHCTQQDGMYTSSTHTIWHEIQAAWYSWHEIQLYFCSTQPVTSGLTRCAGTSSKGSAGSLANARTANSTSCITQVGTCQVNFQLIFTLISSSLIKYSEPISYLQGLFHLTIFVTH